MCVHSELGIPLNFSLSKRNWRRPMSELSRAAKQRLLERIIRRLPIKAQMKTPTRTRVTENLWLGRFAGFILVGKMIYGIKKRADTHYAKQEYANPFFTDCSLNRESYATNPSSEYQHVYTLNFFHLLTYGPRDFRMKA
jgi:hypothetical protein